MGDCKEQRGRPVVLSFLFKEKKNEASLPGSDASFGLSEERGLRCDRAHDKEGLGVVKLDCGNDKLTISRAIRIIFHTN